MGYLSSLRFGGKHLRLRLALRQGLPVVCSRLQRCRINLPTRKEWEWDWDDGPVLHLTQAVCVNVVHWRNISILVIVLVILPLVTVTEGRLSRGALEASAKRSAINPEATTTTDTTSERI